MHLWTYKSSGESTTKCLIIARCLKHHVSTSVVDKTSDLPDLMSQDQFAQCGVPCQQPSHSAFEVDDRFLGVEPTSKVFLRCR